MCERLTVYYADRGGKGGNGPICDMDVGLNFVSRLRASSLTFSEHNGPLSIKCAFRGREFYQVDSGRMAVDERSYLVLNDGQRYASSIESPHEVESFCFWFRPSFAEIVLAG